MSISERERGKREGKKFGKKERGRGGEGREEKGREGKRRKKKCAQNLKFSRKPHIPSFWAEDKDVHQTVTNDCILHILINCPFNIYKN